MIKFGKLEVALIFTVVMTTIILTFFVEVPNNNALILSALSTNSSP